MEYEFRIKINPVLFQQQDQLSFIADLAMVRFLVLCPQLWPEHGIDKLSLFDVLKTIC
jgi:hypothetical protein